MQPSRHARRGAGGRAVLGLTLLFVLAAVLLSAGLVVYAGWRHDLDSGLFAIVVSILSTRAALSWVLWQCSDPQETAEEWKTEYPYF